MSAPATIDSLEFARSAQRLSGRLAVAGLVRLEDLLFDDEGSLEYELSGSQDERNRPMLEIRIAGELHLQCQRCLGRLEYPLRVANTLLVLTRDPQPAEDLDDPEAPEAIESSPELDVAALVEDEVLLSLPLSPRHPEGTCASRNAQLDDENVRAESAFGKLAALKCLRP